jgi:hypothetical protein
MKKSIYLFFTLFVFASAFYITSCKKDPINNPPSTMPAEDAMVEIRSASQEITGNMDEFMSSQAFTTIDVFMGLISYEEEDWKTSVKPSLRAIEKIKISKFKNLIKEKFYVKSISEPDPKVGGVYKYNYSTKDFDLINSGVSYLQFLFPADDADYNAQGWNATMTISNYQYVTIEYDEEIPTKFDVELIAYSNSIMELNFLATYDVDGVPTSMSVTINMPPYYISMTQSVSGSNYNSTFTFKENNYVIMSYNITTTLTPDKEDIVKISGHYQVSPLRIDGYVNVLDMDNCAENDVDCMNGKMSLTMLHTGLNQIIGKIEARLYYDSYYDEYYPDAVIVYADDTWEWLADIFVVDFRK